MPYELFYILLFSVWTFLNIVYLPVICLFGYLVLLGLTLSFATKKMKIENASFFKCLTISFTSIIVTLGAFFLFYYLLIGPISYIVSLLVPSFAEIMLLIICCFWVISAILLALFTFLIAKYFTIEIKMAFRLAFLTVLMNYILGILSYDSFFSIVMLLSYRFQNNPALNL